MTFPLTIKGEKIFLVPSPLWGRVRVGGPATFECKPLQGDGWCELYHCKK